MAKLNLKDLIIKGLIIFLVAGGLIFIDLANKEKIRKKATSELANVETIKKEALLEEYIKKEILFLQWGFGKNEAGLRIIEQPFQKEESRIIRFCGAEIKIDKEEAIYILPKKWSELPSWAKEIKRIDNPYVHKYDKIKIKKENIDEEKYEYLLSVPFEKAENEFSFIDKFTNGSWSEFYQETENRLGVRIIDGRGELVRKIKLQNLDDNLTLNIYILGEDKGKNIYILVDAKFVLEVLKYNQEGNLLTKVELPFDNWIYRLEDQASKLAVDKEGNIYQLLPEENGIHILKWGLK